MLFMKLVKAWFDINKIIFGATDLSGKMAFLHDKEWSTMLIGLFTEANKDKSIHCDPHTSFLGPSKHQNCLTLIKACIRPI